MLPAEIFASPSLCSQRLGDGNPLFSLNLFAAGCSTAFSGTENPGVDAAGVNGAGVAGACVDGPDGPGVPGAGDGFGLLGGGGIFDAASSPETHLRNSPSEPASLGECGSARGISMVCSSTNKNAARVAWGFCKRRDPLSLVKHEQT